MRQKIMIPTATAATTASVEPTITPIGRPIGINIVPEFPAKELAGRGENTSVDSLEVVMTTRK
jgi:hypothetical protein